MAESAPTRRVVPMRASRLVPRRAQNAAGGRSQVTTDWKTREEACSFNLDFSENRDFFKRDRAAHRCWHSRNNARLDPRSHSSARWRNPVKSTCFTELVAQSILNGRQQRYVTLGSPVEHGVNACDQHATKGFIESKGAAHTKATKSDLLAALIEDDDEGIPNADFQRRRRATAQQKFAHPAGVTRTYPPCRRIWMKGTGAKLSAQLAEGLPHARVVVGANYNQCVRDGLRQPGRAPGIFSQKRMPQGFAVEPTSEQTRDVTCSSIAPSGEMLVSLSRTIEAAVRSRCDGLDE